MKKKNFIPIAKDVIETEIRSLKKLKLNINQSFNKAVEAIINCKNGKVIISGIGKSGIIGKKISSTLASVGIPSFYVDAASCSHGDLGKISSNDILILSKYGKKITRHMIFTLIKNISKNSGITKKISPHTFRHSFASHLLKNGADLRTIQLILGHENITTTEIYTHLDSKHLLNVMKKYHPRAE